MSRRQWSIAAGAAIFTAFATGCARESKAPSYGTRMSQEIEDERQEFIAQAREQLGQIDASIGAIDARLSRESPYVSEERRAEWRQDAFELRQERNQLAAELERAELVSTDEWRELRGNVGVMLDSLEAAVIEMGQDVESAFRAP